MKKYYILVVLVCLVLNLEAKKTIETKKYAKVKTVKPMNWFTDILDGIASLWQPVWGKYSEGGSTNTSYPLACADRKYLTLIHFVKPINLIN